MLVAYKNDGDLMRAFRRWMQRLSIKVQQWNAKLRAACMPGGEAFHSKVFPEKSKSYSSTLKSWAAFRVQSSMREGI